MSCGTNHYMLLQLLLFVLLSTILHYSYASSSSSSSILANNTNQQHFAGNNNSRFVTLDQLSSAAIMDLTGSIIEGFYYVEVYIGVPPKLYFFDIDTGSGLTWLQCNPHAPHKYPHPAYKAPDQGTVHCGDQICQYVKHPATNPCNKPTDECHYVAEYADHSSSTGKMVLDSLSLPFRNVDPSLLLCINFGCGLDQKHTSRIHTDGLLGLAKNSGVGIIAQLAKNRITRQVFGHCMSRTWDGYFFIGAGKVLPPGITWAPMVMYRHESLYSPGRANLLLDGSTTDVRNLETVFDSGSTFTYFKSVALEAILDFVTKNINGAPLTPVKRRGTNHPICWRGAKPIKSVDEVATYFKTFSLIFPEANNVRFELPPYAYLTVQPIESDPNEGDVCFGIHNGTEEGLGNLNLIGDIFFQDKLMIYDIDRKMIGWAPSSCDYSTRNDRKNRKREIFLNTTMRRSRPRRSNLSTMTMKA